MADTENKDLILDAMWRGDLTVNEPEEEVKESETEDAPEFTDEQRRERQRAALEHLMSGLAFRERED